MANEKEQQEKQEHEYTEGPPKGEKPYYVFEVYPSGYLRTIVNGKVYSEGIQPPPPPKP